MQSLLAGAQFFFWARLVDRTGNVGPFYPVVNGVLGQSSANAVPVLELIAGQVGESELVKEILDEIELISGSGPGSVNDRLEKAKQELEDLIDQVTDALVYVPTKTYTAGQIVRTGQNLWQALKAVPVDTPPPAADYWFNMGTIAQTTQAMALQIQQNKTPIETVDGKVTANASALQSLQASWREDDGEGDLAGAVKDWDSTARIAQQVKVQASDNRAMVERTTSLDAAVGANKAALTTLEQVVATDKLATIERIDQLKSTVDTNSAAVQTVTQSLADTNKSIASQTTTIEAIAGGDRDGTDEGDLVSAVSEWQNKASIQVTAKAQASTDGKPQPRQHRLPPR